MNFRTARPTFADCELIRSLASRIWAPTYSHLMSADQLDYMFEMMYGVENLHRSMIDGQTFMIFSRTAADENKNAANLENSENSGSGLEIGYVSFEILADHEFYLQKIYLLPSVQGSGAGRRMLEMLLAHLRELDPAARRLGLNVNRSNTRAVCFYLRNGFEITSRRDHPIGRGYFMNDYILHRDLLP